MNCHSIIRHWLIKNRYIAMLRHVNDRQAAKIGIVLNKGVTLNFICVNMREIWAMLSAVASYTFTWNLRYICLQVGIKIFYVVYYFSNPFNILNLADIFLIAVVSIGPYPENLWSFLHTSFWKFSDGGVNFFNYIRFCPEFDFLPPWDIVI